MVIVLSNQFFVVPVNQEGIQPYAIVQNMDLRVHIA